MTVSAFMLGAPQSFTIGRYVCLINPKSALSHRPVGSCRETADGQAVGREQWYLRSGNHSVAQLGDAETRLALGRARAETRNPPHLRGN